MKRIAVTEDYLLGRVLALNVVDPETGEIVANANDEVTEAVLDEIAVAHPPTRVLGGISVRF